MIRTLNLKAHAQVYTIWSILFIVFIILIIVTAFITVALTYFQLAVEDHRWWWRSFLCGGATGQPLRHTSGWHCLASGARFVRQMHPGCHDMLPAMPSGAVPAAAHSHTLRLCFAGFFVYAYCFYYFSFRCVLRTDLRMSIWHFCPFGILSIVAAHRLNLQVGSWAVGGCQINVPHVVCSDHVNAVNPTLTLKFCVRRSDMHGFMQTSFFFSALSSQMLSNAEPDSHCRFCGCDQTRNMCSPHLAATACLHCRLHGVHLLWAVPHAGGGRLEVQPLVYTAYIQGERASVARQTHDALRSCCCRIALHVAEQFI